MEEKILKEKYNDLLSKYNSGLKYIQDNPEKEEEAKKRLTEIENELSNIMEALPDMTEKEKLEGFVIEEPVEAKPIETKPVAVKENVQPTNTIMDFKNNWIIAEKLSKSSLLPEEFKGHPENVIIALGMAEKMKMDPFTICQNLHIIRGKLSWSGAFCKTLIEQSGKYTDIDFVYFGDENTDDYGCYLEATRIRDGKRIQGNKVTVKLAKEEKWYTTNTKWRTMTAQMLGYRAAAFFARLYCGEMLNGIMTSEENMDIEYQREQPKDIL